MDVIDELTDLSGAPPHEVKAVADRAIKEIEKLRNKTRWLELVENTVVKQDKEIERLREALNQICKYESPSGDPWFTYNEAIEIAHSALQQKGRK